MYMLLLSSLLSLLFKLHVLVYHKICMCMNINKLKNIEILLNGHVINYVKFE